MSEKELVCVQDRTDPGYKTDHENMVAPVRGGATLGPDFGKGARINDIGLSVAIMLSELARSKAQVFSTLAHLFVQL